MDDLIGLVKSLNKREKDLVRLIYSRNVNKEEKLKLKLFNLLAAKKVMKIDEIIISLEYKGSSSAFSHLKRRLKKDILNIILFQETGKKFRAKIFSESIEIKKTMVFAELLYRRGLSDLADNIINEGIKVSNKFEFLAERYILTDLQRMRQGITKGPKVITSFNEKINFYIDTIQSNSNSVGLFYDFTVRNINKSNTDIVLLDQEKNYLKKLKDNYSNFPIAKNGYWYHRAAIFYYNSIINYEEALVHGKLLLKLIIESPSLYSPVVYAGTLKEIAEISISGGQYKEAKEYLNDALNIFNPELNNYLLTLESYFIATFHLNEIETARTTLAKAERHPNFKSRKLIKARWEYFEACILFKENKFKESYSKLSKISSVLVSDKGELQIGYRLLLVYLLYHNSKFDLFEYEIQSLEKSIKKIKGIKLSRIKIIISHLKKLIKMNFIIDKNNFNLKLLIHELEKDKNNKWSPLGVEIINFEYFIDNI